MKRIFLPMLFVGFAISAVSAAVAGTWEYDFTKMGANALKKDWKAVAGTFKVDNGSLWQTDPSADDNNAFRAIAQTSWQLADGTVEAKVKHDDKAAGLNDCLIFYRMKTDDDGYASRLQLDSYITIGKITAGRHAHIQFLVMPVVAAKWYTMKLELKGAKITVLVDNKEYITLSDNWSSQGRVGFGMSRSNGGARLEWMRVTGDGVTGLSVQPNGKAAITWSELKTR